MLWWDFPICLLILAIGETEQWNSTGMFHDTDNDSTDTHQHDMDQCVSKEHIYVKEGESALMVWGRTSSHEELRGNRLVVNSQVIAYLPRNSLNMSCSPFIRNSSLEELCHKRLEFFSNTTTILVKLRNLSSDEHWNFTLTHVLGSSSPCNPQDIKIVRVIIPSPVLLSTVSAVANNTVRTPISGEGVVNPDGSITLPTENITVSEHQSDLILTANITLPNDTVSVGNVLVFVYTEDDIGGRLLSHPVNTSGTTQVSPEAEMVHKFKLETANVTLTSQLTKNSTTNRFKVRAVFKIALSSSTLYLQSLMIRKILFVVTSCGQDDRRNEKQYLIFYSKSAPPSAPRNLKTQTVFDDAAIYIQLKWDPPSTDGGTEIKHYVIQYVAKGLSWKSPNEAETTSTEYGDLRLPNGKYSARVRAQNKAGLGPPSNEVIIDLETTLLVRPTSPSVDINILLSSLTTSVVPSPVHSTVALSSPVVQETDKPPATGPGNKSGAVIGGIIGAVAAVLSFILLIIGIAVWYKKRHRRQRDDEGTAKQSQNHMMCFDQSGCRILTHTQT